MMRKDVVIIFFLILTSLVGSFDSLPQGIASQGTVIQEYGADNLLVRGTTEISQVLQEISSEHILEGTTTQSNLSPNEEIPVLPGGMQNNTTTTSTSTTSSTTSTTEPVTTPAPTTPYAPTTHRPSTSSTTQKPNDKPCKKFDGPSFVGGVVLTMGLLAIAFVAYKFYKARNERNYHTL